MSIELTRIGRWGIPPLLSFFEIFNSLLKILLNTNDWFNSLIKDGKIVSRVRETYDMIVCWSECNIKAAVNATIRHTFGACLLIPADGSFGIFLTAVSFLGVKSNFVLCHLHFI
jgi:hypothetical protein